MLGMANTFEILALVAGVLGFVALAGSLAVIAKILSSDLVTNASPLIA
jgi:uncharacterized membrane protein YtjA (UPF0391 family)